MTATDLAFDPDLLPSDEEVEEYRRRGWYASRAVFTDAELDAAIEGSERFYRGEVTETPGVDVPAWVRPEGSYGDELRKHDYANFLCPELHALVTKPVLGAIAARLAGVDVVRLWHTQLLYKPPTAAGARTNVGWHTDHHYWLTSSSDRMLTAWVPLVDVDEEIGTITMIDGSNRWDDDDSDLSFFEQDLDEREASFRARGHALRKVPMRLARGQVSFHHMRTVHGSGPNRSDRIRRSMAVHLQPGDNRWRWGLKRRDDGYRVTVHANDFIVPRRGEHGVPDYTDAGWFPVLHDSGAG